MIIFVFGKESYLALERYLQLKREFFEKNQTAHLDEFDLAENFDLGEVSQALSGGGGLFAQKKLVVFKNVFFSSDSNKKTFEEVLIGSGATKDENVFVLIYESDSKLVKGGLLKVLKKEAKVEEYKQLKPPELSGWIQQRIAQQGEGIRIEESAIGSLVGLSGGNLWQIKNEIDKLCSFKQKGAISSQDVELLCRGKTNVKIFDLVDAIGQNNKMQAIKLKDWLISQGENEFFVFTMIVSQIRNLIKVQQCNDKGIFDEKQVSIKLSMHPFVAKKSLAQLRNFSKKQLKMVYQLAADLDLATKRGEQKMEEALDYMIAKI
ncbi:MAG: DNA polymerase III subunit delta [Patescibacteria group bacterium]|nr:DNA polymerase III subunit delta [Patescibacteria group bacterium]